MTGHAAVAVPAYSEVGAGNRDLFLSYRNPVLIYCEDEGWEEFYLRLANRVLDGVQVEDVFCLGGKSLLVERLGEQPPANRRRIFLFDKDFDDLLGKVERAKEVVYVPRYSIENFFIDEGLLVDFALDLKKRVRRAEIVDLVRFEERLAALLLWYPELCRYFVLSIKFRLGVAGPKLSIWDIAETDGAVKQGWMERYRESFLEQVRLKQGWLLEDGRLEAELAAAFDATAGSEDIADMSELCHLPGKHFVEFFVDTLRNGLQLKESDVCSRYAFLMISVGRTPEHLFAILRERCQASLS